MHAGWQSPARSAFDAAGWGYSQSSQPPSALHPGFPSIPAAIKIDVDLSRQCCTCCFGDFKMFLVFFVYFEEE